MIYRVISWILLFAYLGGAGLSGCTKKKDEAKKDAKPSSKVDSRQKLEEKRKRRAKEVSQEIKEKYGIDLSVDEKGLSKATVTIKTKKGDIKYKFYTEDAPNTAARIATLVKEKFYDGLKFHRVEPGFVVQGGDPKGNGTGGSGQKLKAEFNQRLHLKGTVAMARAKHPDSADSQFYICLDKHPHLDFQYTVFGQTIAGQEVVDRIAPGDVMTSVSIE